MSTKPSSPDYDPYEHALEIRDDIENAWNMEASKEFRLTKRALTAERNAELRAENNARMAKRDQESARLAEQRLNTNEALALLRLEQRQTERSEIDARARRVEQAQAEARAERADRANRTLAFRQSQAQERADRRNAGPGFKYQGASAPSVSSNTKGVQTGQGWNPSKGGVASFIIAVTTIGAITSVAADVQASPLPVVMPDGTRIPPHLRVLGGVLIAGTVALVINEIYPAAGALMGLGILTIVVIPNLLTVAPQFGSALKLKGAKQSPFAGVGGGSAPALFDPNVNISTPQGEAAIRAWIKAHPGDVPFKTTDPKSPQAKWNRFAMSQFALTHPVDGSI
jgi:hypothetical protein